ncbi:copper resistance protein B [Paraburkholderia diazotrophica]|uniref:copper resistance protein B n=1 Tax=Paraburkholderia diazotrophica TaxID=667676 RepID=UPI00316D84C2
MIKTRQTAAIVSRRFLWITAGLLAAPALSIAQVAQPPAGSSMPSMNAAPHEAHSMSGMQMPSTMGSMQNGSAAPQGKNPMAGMRMGSMQGGSAPPDARRPDYSEGVSASSEPGMDMDDAAPVGMLQFDQLEAFHDKDTNGLAWEMHGWYGNDSNKLWIRSEGERSGGHFEDADVEALWSHAVAAYWDTELGIRQDFGDGPSRHWAAFGVQGIVPYNFDIEATGYVDPTGRTAARVRAEYDMRFTQRLILQPDLEVNAYGRSDPARRIGGGISDAQFGVRLRYEINRRVAPYIGVEWKRRFGATANLARDDRQAVFDQQWVAGIRIWY